MEADAGTITGIPVEIEATEPGKRRWSLRVPGAIRLRDGSAFRFSIVSTPPDRRGVAVADVVRGK